jgi:hypothetical protein
MAVDAGCRPSDGHEYAGESMPAVILAAEGFRHAAVWVGGHLQVALRPGELCFGTLRYLGFMPQAQVAALEQASVQPPWQAPGRGPSRRRVRPQTGPSIVIAILGIVSTLALSILERTRELGLLRAVGLLRTQVAQMVTVESIVISVFGALLGLVVGSALGAAVVRALRDFGIPDLRFSWGTIGVFLLLAVVVGLVAAIVPAIRAARTDVLKAIAYE